MVFINSLSFHLSSTLGGVLGLHCAVKLQALQDGVRTNTKSNILKAIRVLLDQDPWLEKKLQIINQFEMV